MNYVDSVFGWKIEVKKETTEEEESPIEDPLEYWVENEAKYETLLPMIAQDILCIPAIH